MKNILRARASLWIIFFCLSSSGARCFAVDIGAARVEVTPREPVRLTGYAARQTPSTGVEQKLWAKALAIGNDEEMPVILITLDNCGIAAETFREVAQRLARHGIAQDHFTIACSHTHSAPATKNWAPNIFVQDLPADQLQAIERYTSGLIDSLEKVALDALKNRRPGRLSWSRGSVDFARNRRVVRGNTTAPVDHSLLILKAETANGNLIALVANYACHCTTIGSEFNHACGDWAGFAQAAMEREHPDAVAMITIGCGADANPAPRGGADGGLALARQHGEELATEVRRLLGFSFVSLPGKVRATSKEIALPFGPNFTRDQWLARSTNSGIVGYHAKKWLARLDRGEKTPESLYYPITTWNFGDDLAMVFLPGEVVVDYALRLQRELDSQRLWVSSYANYVPCYIPSRRILAEGGYEAEESLWYYDRPARISTNAEDLIIQTVEQLTPKSMASDARKAALPDPKTPNESLRAMRTRADLTIDLAASEPLIESPVAIAWDARGRLWVCEMYDYPLGIGAVDTKNSRYGENPKSQSGLYQPGGRIKILTDTNGDGIYDTSTLFLDGLPFPTGVTPWGDGVLICAAPNVLYAVDTDGDGRADLIRTNLTGFATHNYQARINGFVWGLDGWLHGSSGLFGGKIKCAQTGKEVDLSGRDFRYRPETGELEPVSGISQYGRVRDDFDNWFGNDNSTWLWQFPLPDHYLRRNPNVAYPDPRVLVSDYADVNKLFPISRTLERFNDPLMVNIVTSACGPEIFRDTRWGEDYYANAFICEPVHNLVRRLVLQRDGVVFKSQIAPGEERGEFLSSSDNWFRPVQVQTGPDGALYVVDMYRFVIEHARWIPPERLKELDVRAGADLGRIYRVHPKNLTLSPIRDLTKLSEAEGIDAFNTPNGPTRDLLEQRMVARGVSAAAKTRLASLARGGATSPAVRAQALSCLQLLGANSADTLKFALRDADPGARKIAVRAAEDFARLGKIRLPETDSDVSVRLQLALSAGERPDRGAGRQLAALAGAGDRWVRAAVLSSSTGHAVEIFRALFSDFGNLDNNFAGQLVSVAAASSNAQDWQQLARLMIAKDGAPSEPWQWNALASLLDTLQRQGVALDNFEGANQSAARDAARRIQLALARARSVAGDERLGETSRAAAIRLLGRRESERAHDLDFLLNMLHAGVSARLQSAATETLRHFRGPQFAETALGMWGRLTPSARAIVVDLLVSRSEWAAALVDAVSKAIVAPQEVSALGRKRLLEYKDAGVRDQAARLFTSQPSSDRAGVIAQYQAALELPAAPERGAALFEKNCAPCHALRGHGNEVGPNLAEFAGKSGADFLQAILDPNAAINPNFLAYEIETKEGRALSGIVRGENASGLTLVQGGGVRETLRRSDISSMRASRVSLMPEGFEQAMAPKELADLIAWVKGSAPARFGGATSAQSIKAREEFLGEVPNGLATIVSAAATLPYPSWLGALPMPYCRQNAGQRRLTWKTAPIPNKLEPIHTFRLPVAMGFLSQPAGKFTLKVNGQALLDFDVALNDQTWESSDHLARMRYLVKEANAEDSNGVLTIQVPAALLKPGEPAILEVIGSDSDSQRWFGVYLLPTPSA